MCRRYLVWFGTVLLGIATSACSEEGERTATPVEATDPPALYESPAFKRVESRVRALEREIEADPGDARLHLELGRLLIKGGIGGRGEAEVRSALRLDPDLTQAAVSIVRMYLSRGEMDAAREQLDAALARGETAELRALEAEWIRLSRPDDEEAAERALSVALRLDPDSAAANYELGLVRLRRGEAGEAAARFERAIAADPIHLGAHFNLARAYRLTGEEELAARAAARHQRLSRLDDLGMRKRAGSLQAHMALAEMLLSADDVEAAVRELDAAIERFPGEPAPRVTKAITLLKSGDDAAGLAAFEEAVRALPENAAVLNHYAWYLATSAGDDDSKRRAVTLAEEAVSLSKGRNVGMLQTLAQAQVAAGDSEAAFRTLERALALAPNDPELARRIAQLRGRNTRNP